METNQTKKDLMRLGTTELIKKCKKEKLSTTGSKLQLIDRLLKRQKKIQIKELKKAQQQFTKQVNYLSIDIATDYIVNHYIHNIDIHTICPKSLISLIIKYIGLYITKIFDCCPDEFKNDISNNGILIKRGKHDKRSRGPKPRKGHSGYSYAYIPYRFFFGSSNGYKQNSVIHQWSIKINKLSNKGDQIGIISDKKEFEWYISHDMQFDIKCSAYFMEISDKAINFKIQCVSAKNMKLYSKYSTILN